MQYNYQETFELMKAYHSLGEPENKIIQYLMKMDYFEGNYVELAKEINMEQGNLRNFLLYLDALGIVNIVRSKYIDEVKQYIRKDRRKASTHNKMKACYLVDGWMDILVNQYKKGNILVNAIQKKEYINHIKELWNE